MRGVTLQGDITNLGALGDLLRQELSSEHNVNIVWSSSVRAEEGTVVINRPEALANLEFKAALWGAAGVPCGPTKANYYRRYRYYMFDLLPVRILRREIGQRRILDVSWGTSRETRNGVMLAARALHVLRLDAGMVELGVDSKGELCVIDVSAAPKLSKRMARAYIKPLMGRVKEEQFFRSSPAEITVERRVNLGADPEFMLRDSRTNRLIMASRFFPRSGQVGCDARYVKLQGGGYPLAELRPAPSWSPIRLCSNIRSTMEKALRLAPYTNVQWRGGSMPFSRFPIGGHIHFTGVPISGPLLRCLDNYLGLPLLLVEKSTTARRRRSNHGYLGDFRVKAHGGFEYRTPASWLVSPMIAQAALCLARIVASEYTVLTQDLFTTPEAHKNFLQSNKEFFLPKVKSLWKDIESTRSYQYYKSELHEFGKMLEQGRSWNETLDLRRTWQLSIPRNRVFYK